MQNLSSVYPNLARACEIALNGGFSIDLFYDPETYPEAPKDFQKIKTFFKGVEFRRSGDIKVELCQPDPERMSHKAEEPHSILQKAKKLKVKYLALDSAADRLLKMAAEKLGFGVETRDEILKLADIIQQMTSPEGHLLKAEAMAEAIHFIATLSFDDVKNVIEESVNEEFKNVIFNLSLEEKERVLKFLGKK